MKIVIMLVLVAVVVAMVWRLAAAPSKPKDPRDGDGT